MQRGLKKEPGCGGKRSPTEGEQKVTACVVWDVEFLLVKLEALVLVPQIHSMV